MSTATATPLEGLAPGPVSGEDEPPVKKPTGKPTGKKPTTKAGDAPPRGPGRPSNRAKLETSLTELVQQITTAGMMATAGPEGLAAYANGGAMPRGSVARDFELVNAQAAAIARLLVRLSDRNPTVRKWLDAAVSTGNYAEGLALVGGLVFAILANHDVLPASMAPLAGVAPDAPPSPAG